MSHWICKILSISIHLYKSYLFYSPWQSTSFERPPSWVAFTEGFHCTCNYPCRKMYVNSVQYHQKYITVSNNFKMNLKPIVDIAGNVQGNPRYMHCVNQHHIRHTYVFVRRAGLLWSQEDFEWRWSVPLFKCLTVLEFSFILFDLCLLITFFNFIMNYVPIVTFWIFTYHKIWILSIMFCSIWSYWIIYFFSMFGSVLESCELTGVCLLLPWLIKWK